MKNNYAILEGEKGGLEDKIDGLNLNIEKMKLMDQNKTKQINDLKKEIFVLKNEN